MYIFSYSIWVTMVEFSTQKETPSSSRERAVGELLKGRNSAVQLQILLQDPHGNVGSESADDLVVKILRSLTDTLSVLRSSSSGQVGRVPATPQLGSVSCCRDLRSRNSGDSGKGPPVKDRRGSYKRRGTLKSNVVVSPTTEDGFAWRKYGQKAILNAKHPRCYYRCTHKPSDGCKAMKQVQKMENNSNLYQTTYIGQHTCKDLSNTPNIIPNSHFEDWNSPNFESKSGQDFNQDHPSCSTIPNIVKEDTKEEEETQSQLSDNLSSLNSNVFPDLVPLESPEVIATTSSESGSIPKDLILRNPSWATPSSSDFDLDFLSSLFDLENG